MATEHTAVAPAHTMVEVVTIAGKVAAAASWGTLQRVLH